MEYPIIEIPLVMLCVVLLIWEGIWIGREFGTFEKFVLVVLKKIESKLKCKPE